MVTARIRSSPTPLIVLIVIAFFFCVVAYGQSSSSTSRPRPIQQDGKWGYIDATGKIVIKPQFAWAEEFSEGLAGFESEDGKHGYVDETGKIVIEPKFDNWTEFSEGLAAVSVDFEWGYIDKTGKIVIKVQCDDAEQFTGGLASVRIGEEKAERRGYINKLGKFVWGPVAFKYKSMEEIAARAEKKEKEEEVLTPLTEEERSLNARDIILNQPDFVADLNFFVSEGFGGHGGAERLARKGNRYREESQFWIFIGELGKPSARLFPQAKAYDDFESARGGSADSTPINPAALAVEPDVTFTALGTRVVDGHNCLKIEATRKGKPEKFYFFAARDLKNLVIVAQIVEPRRNTVQTLSNISLDVPDSLVRIPSDYKPIEHDRWVKLENAKVTYGGRASKDFVVFRAPDGQLFVRVNDAPYPWTYLVRPKEATVETAFQGLLVTRSGEYIWQTKETEGFSQTYYRTPRPPSEWEKEDDRRVIVKPNSVTFRSTDYNRNKAMIEVSW